MPELAEENVATFDAAALARAIEDAKRQIGDRLGDVDPGDLDLILSSLLRPFGSGRRFFLREIRAGVHVF